MADIFLQCKNGTYAFNPFNKANLLGEGGMGRVFKGVNVKTKENVAIKVIHRELTSNENVIRRVIQEGNLRLNNSNIVKIHDSLVQNGIYHIISEYLVGENVELVLKKGRLDVKETAEIICQTLDGLSYLHSQTPPIYHRDIKPSNLFSRINTSASGKNIQELKIIDLGVASIASGQRLTRAGVVLGTPHYSAPEQIKGENNKINATTDIYSTGIVLYELLTGKVPFDAGSQYDIMEMQVKMQLPGNSNIPKSLFNVIKKATEKEQNKRFQTAIEFKEAIIATQKSKGIVIFGWKLF